MFMRPRASTSGIAVVHDEYAAWLCVRLAIFQVRAFRKDKSNPEIFDDVNVYGNIYDSDIHHNHFGVYTYGKSR